MRTPCGNRPGNRCRLPYEVGLALTRDPGPDMARNVVGGHSRLARMPFVNPAMQRSAPVPFGVDWPDGFARSITVRQE